MRWGWEGGEWSSSLYCSPDLINRLADVSDGVWDGGLSSRALCSREVEGRQVEGVGTAADMGSEVLGNLDEDLLPVGLVRDLVSLGQEELELVGVAPRAQALHGRHAPPAGGLADGVQKDQDEVRVVGQSRGHVQGVAGVLHVAVHQPRRVDEVHAVKASALGRAHLLSIHNASEPGKGRSGGSTKGRSVGQSRSGVQERRGSIPPYRGEAALDVLGAAEALKVLKVLQGSVSAQGLPPPDDDSSGNACLVSRQGCFWAHRRGRFTGA